ncbi:hypothetical protein LVJ94_32005 [Pendulispora rubella]|uniref:Uncharacterized protein n=1 Tax=Pendulispora rubella TaxID=2741070 RepID=A0ABZ2KVD0_9BACT
MYIDIEANGRVVICIAQRERRLTLSYLLGRGLFITGLLAGAAAHNEQNLGEK